jgi:hypothetical protein
VTDRGTSDRLGSVASTMVGAAPADPRVLTLTPIHRINILYYTR